MSNPLAFTTMSRLFQIAERDGVKMQLTISDAEFPYEREDNPVYAQIELPDGTVVLAYDFGARASYLYSDGVRVRSWVHPVLIGTEDIYSGITSEQFAMLEEANGFAAQFFDGSPDSFTNEQLVRKVTAVIGANS